jgi:triosephosphate isomerase
VHLGVEITPPFFEVGPKAYAFGRELLRLAMCADRLSEDYGVQIIITPQNVDIPVVAQHVERVLVFAQHMDSLEPGRGVGSVLPEALKEAGAVGVLLNHAERPLQRKDLAHSIRRADEVGLATLVCADDAAEAASIAHLTPNAIIVEAPALIGSSTGAHTTRATITETDRAIWRVDPAIRVLHAAGIGSAQDVYDVIAAGAQGTGSSSAIFTAENPEAVLKAMIRATREAWDARTQGASTA